MHPVVDGSFGTFGFAEMDDTLGKLDLDTMLSF